MTRLDTHVVIWLYTGETERLSADAHKAIEEHQLVADALVSGTSLVTKDRSIHERTAIALW